MEDKAVVFEDYLVTIGLDLAKDRLTGSYAKNELRDRLKTFIEKQKKYNFNCSKDEEIDFEALATYIQEDLIDDYEVSIFGNKQERDEARREIIKKVRIFSQSNTKLAEKRALQIVEKSIAILRAFYRRKVSKELFLVASQIEETLSDEMNSSTERLSEQLSNIGSTINQANVLSIDTNISHMKAGNIAAVEDNLSTFLKTINLTHRLSPYYGFKLENNKLISIPLTDEALILYPPKFNVTASSLHLGDKIITKIDDDILSQSYRHQIPITIDITSAKKYLGDIPDPVQHEAEEMSGAHVIMTPPSFPPAFPCSISVDNITYFDYVLLRTEDIKDDGLWLVSNYEQENIGFYISLTISPNTNHLSFNIAWKNPSNAELLNYYQFIAASNKSGNIRIKALEKNETLVEGKFNPSEVTILDNEISLLEKIVAIEKYFNIAFSIPDWVSREEYETIVHIYDLIVSGEYRSSWSNMDFTFIATPTTREKIIEMTDDIYTLIYACPQKIVLFNQTIQLAIRRQINGAIIDDINKVKAKAKLLYDDETIKIRFIPKSSKRKSIFSDTLASEGDEFTVLIVIPESDIKE